VKSLLGTTTRKAPAKVSNGRGGRGYSFEKSSAAIMCPHSKRRPLCPQIHSPSKWTRTLFDLAADVPLPALPSHLPSSFVP